MPQHRLVKVIVQPVFVLDHGTHIEESEHPAGATPARDWPTYGGCPVSRSAKSMQTGRGAGASRRGWEARADESDTEACGCAPSGL